MLRHVQQCNAVFQPCPLHCSPAVVASYAVSSISAVASALCYAEYAVDFPIAGGGYGFVSLTYGEFIGWWVALCL